MFHSKIELQDHIKSGIEELIETPNSRILLSSASRGWGVVHSYEISNRLLCEFPSNKLLKEDKALSTEHQHALLQLGYTSRRSKRCFGTMCSGAENEASLNIAKNLVEGAMIFSSDLSSWSVSIDKGHRQTLSNRTIGDQMRKLSKKRTHEARIELYKMLLNSVLLLALDENGVPLVVDKIGKFPCYGIFTEARHLYHFDPRGLNVQKDYGSTIFPILNALKPGSVFLNPQCELRGELYRNEIESLAQAVRRR